MNNLHPPNSSSQENRDEEPLPDTTNPQVKIEEYLKSMKANSTRKQTHDFGSTMNNLSTSNNNYGMHTKSPDYFLNSKKSFKNDSKSCTLQVNN